MLAGLERQRGVGDRFLGFRLTFEHFLKAGERHDEPGFFIRPRYWWSREEKLSHNGQEFTLNICSETGPELRDTQLQIRISSDYGGKDLEFLPSFSRGLKKPHKEIVQILDNLSDLEAVVREFNQAAPQTKTVGS